MGLVWLSRWNPEAAGAEEESRVDPGRHRRPQRGGKARRRLGNVSPSMAIIVAVCLASGTAWSVFTGTTSNASNSLTATNPFLSYPATVTGDSALLYYRCDETASTTATDSSGHGTTGGYWGLTQWYQVPGGITGDTAMRFPGYNYAGTYVPWTSSTANFNTYSMEVWFKAPAGDPGGMLASDGQSTKQSSSTNFSRHVWLGTDGKVYFGMYVSGSKKSVASTAATYADNAWHQVVATYTSGAPGTMTLYVDGASQGTNSIATPVLPDGYFRLGGDHFPAGWPGGAGATNQTNDSFDGYLDEFSVYTTALSAARVTAHYSNANNFTNYTNAVKADSPWGFWHLDDAAPAGAANGAAALTDSSGNGNTAVSFNMGNVNMTQGNAGALVGGQSSSTAIHVGGSSNGYSQSVANPTTFSYELWFKTNSSTGGTIVDFGDTNNLPSSTNIDRALYMDTAGKLHFGVGASGATTVASTAAYNDNAWHQAIATYSATGMYLYVDGNQVASNASPGAPINFTGYWRWGGDTLSGWPSNPTDSFITAYLDEFSVYTTQLSAQQVMWHYYANH
jgi:hypothetical protein